MGPKGPFGPLHLTSFDQRPKAAPAAAGSRCKGPNSRFSAKKAYFTPFAEGKRLRRSQVPKAPGFCREAAKREKDAKRRLTSDVFGPKGQSGDEGAKTADVKALNTPKSREAAVCEAH